MNFAVEPGTASPGDYAALHPGVLNFAGGETAKTVAVTINGDAQPEPDETFALKLSSPVGGTIADPSGTATIRNDDAGISVNDVSVAEGAAATTKVANSTVTRVGSLSGTSTVQYATANGSAVAPGDYVAKALTTLTFGAGETTKTVSVTIKGDSAVEANETFFLSLSVPVGATLLDGSGTGTIRNDD